MRKRPRRPLLLAALAFTMASGTVSKRSPLAFDVAEAADPSALVDDRRITIASSADVDARRQALIQFIWGSSGFPASKLPSSVERNVASPVQNLGNLERVDTLHVGMDAGEEGLAHHFLPLRKNDRLVILHHGHACTFDDSSDLADTGYGMQRTIHALLSDGYSVLAAFMPHSRPDDCGLTAAHDRMFRTISLPSGSPLKFFLEPVAVSLNYVKAQASVGDFPTYQDVSMVGLSGGGWTTTVYAAVDPAIKLSIPVAGTIPLYLRSGWSVGDTEQTLSSFYQLAGYPDLYVLGATGAGRKQVQVLNRRDDCCFGEAEYSMAEAGLPFVEAVRQYEAQVRGTIARLDSGSFRLEIDEAAPAHMISWNTLVNVIQAELRTQPETEGSDSVGFIRGPNGHLCHRAAGESEDLGFGMVGVPAVVQGMANEVDVFFRDPANRVKHAYRVGSQWAIQDMPGGVMITDPVAASWGNGRLDVAALGADYRLYHWWWNGGPIVLEQVSGVRGLGPPKLTSGAVDQLEIMLQGWDGSTLHLSSRGSAPWPLEA